MTSSTTDLARIDGTTPMPAMDNAREALRSLGDWVTAAQQALQLVGPLVGTPFVPAAYWPKVDPRATDIEKAEARQTAIANATAAVLQGITLGLDPLTALQQIYVVHGRPGMYTKIKVALLLARGHEIWTEDLSDTRAVVAGRRRGTTQIERITVTMDQARRAGWTKNETYAKTPQDMLWARAAGRVADRIAPDALMGIASVEELQDSIQTTAQAGLRTVTPTPKAAITARPVEPAAGSDAPPPADEAPLDERQWRAINEALREQGIVGQGQQARRLDRIGELIGRAIQRGTDLTYAEGEQILAALRSPQPSDDTDVPAEAPSTFAAESAETAAAGDADTLLDDGWPATAQQGSLVDEGLL